ncbi:MAG: CapA family protein [Myxococcaceae bacterium]
MLPAFLLAIPALLGAAPERLTLVVGGDVIPHTAVKATAQDHARAGPGGESQNHEGWDHVFGPLAEVLRSADLAFVNLESPLAASRTARAGGMTFSAPPAMAGALATAGVDVVSVANNHSRDQRAGGIVGTLAHLDASAIASTGAGETMEAAFRPAILERKGVRVGFLALTRWLNGFENQGPGRPYVFVVRYSTDPVKGAVSEAYALERVREAASLCDFLVVSIHWGKEYSAQPRRDDRRFARRLVDAGAGAVVGSHPHVLQPIERHASPDGREGVILYSLGNLVSGQSPGDMGRPGASDQAARRDSMLGLLTLGRTEGGAVRLERVEVLPLWTENRPRRLDGKRRSNVQPVLIDRELFAIGERLSQLAGRADPSSAREALTLRRRLALTRSRRALICGLLGAGYLPPGPELAQATALAGKPESQQ